MTVRANQLAGLSAAIERVSRLDVPADTVLTAFFRANAAMGQRDRAFVAEGAYAYLLRKLKAMPEPEEPLPTMAAGEAGLAPTVSSGIDESGAIAGAGAAAARDEG